MLKKLLLIWLLVIMCGCESNNLKDNEINSNDNIEKVLKENNYIEKKLNCNFELADIKDITIKNMDNHSYILLIDNSLYEYDFEKKYKESDNNCKLLDTNGNIITHFSLRNLYPTDLEEHIFMDNFNPKFLEYSPESKIKDSYPNSTIQLYIGANSIIVENNKAYLIYNNTKNEFIIDNDETISNVYSINDNLVFIETTNNIYDCNFVEINEDNCNEYVDIECPRTFQCSKSNITNYKNEILFFNGNFIITKNNTLYLKN